MVNKVDTSKAYVSNYPALQNWLDKVGARAVHQLKMGTAFLEVYLINNRVCIVEVRANLHGWNIYTPCDMNDIATTLADADARLGVK